MQADRQDRRYAEDHRRHEQDPVDPADVERDVEEHDADEERDRRAHRPDPDPGHPAAEDHREEVARADVQVLEHPVALAVVEDHPGEAADAGQDERPERAADHDERPIVGAGAAADHVEHDDEDQGRRQGLGDRVDEEQERVRPVRLHLPAETDGGQEASPDVDPAAAARSGVVEPAPLGRGEAGRVGSEGGLGGGHRARPAGRAAARTAARTSVLIASAPTGGPRPGPSARGRGASRRTGR